MRSPAILSLTESQSPDLPLYAHTTPLQVLQGLVDKIRSLGDTALLAMARVSDRIKCTAYCIGV